jgi:hypothetical protein
MRAEPLYDKIDAVIQAHLAPQNDRWQPGLPSGIEAGASFTISGAGSWITRAAESARASSLPTLGLPPWIAEG